jgi:hypothetical protein
MHQLKMTAVVIVLSLLAATVRALPALELNKSQYAVETRNSPVLIAQAEESTAPLKLPGFRVALAIASLPGITPKLFNGFRRQHTKGPSQMYLRNQVPAGSVSSPANAGEDLRWGFERV